ncbi:MAG: hypothetical protein M0Z31_08805 [Clostridia bacterium]|nr:hypothetical protein [Clostridia bacterium]
MVDTDRDLLSDGKEVGKYRTNPVKADTDTDGLDDGTDENNLALFWFDPVQMTPVQLSNSWVDPVSNTVYGETYHFSEFLILDTGKWAHGDRIYRLANVEMN